MANYPVSATQQKVLNALGMTAMDFQDAEKVFDAIGIEVSSKRVGRSTEPVIRMKSRFGGGWNAGGDGSAWSNTHKQADLDTISQWIVK